MQNLNFVPTMAFSSRTARCSWASSPERSRVVQAGGTQPDLDAIQRHRRRGCTGRCRLAQHRPRSELRNQWLLLRLLCAHAGLVEPRPRLAVHRCAGLEHDRRRTARSSSSRTTRSSTTDAHHGATDRVRQRREALLHDGRQGLAIRRTVADELPREDPSHQSRTGRFRPTTRSYDGNGPNVDSIWALGLRNPFRA